METEKIKVKCSKCGKIVLRNSDEINLIPRKKGLCPNCWKAFKLNTQED